MSDDATDPAMLTLAGLTSHGRRGRRAWGGLDGLSLSPVPGALTAALGPAGAGKSALIRALAGAGRPRGTMTLDGRDLGRVPAWRRGFGVVLQGDALFPHLTLAENVAFGLRVRGVRRAARGALAQEALGLVGLDDAGGRLPAQASAAQCQRAMLARASVFAPRVLLLDEPFSAQDPAERAAMVAGLRRIHALLGTTTTLLATRVGADALAVADRVAVLCNGAVAQHGTPDEVFDRPANGVVAGLLGETNRLAGTVLEIDDEVSVVRLACGPVVEAAAGPALRAGDACVVSVRPDRIAMAAASASELGGQAVDATVLEAQFQGDSYRVRLLIGTGAEVVVRRAAAAGCVGMGVGRWGGAGLAGAACDCILGMPARSSFFPTTLASLLRMYR